MLLLKQNLITIVRESKNSFVKFYYPFFLTSSDKNLIYFKTDKLLLNSTPLKSFYPDTYKNFILNAKPILNLSYWDNNEQDNLIKLFYEMHNQQATISKLTNQLYYIISQEFS